MSEFILIHYKPGHSSGLQYWAMGADQHPSITLAHGKLEELAAVSHGKKVIVLIDAHYTTLESVNIPSKNRTKQRQAIPFAMEDHLADDIEDTHFAIGKAEDNHSIPVIAIQRKLLEETLQLFAQYNIKVDAISADSIAMPGSNQQWCILLDEDSALIRTGSNRAHCCDRENTALIVDALLQQATQTPESILFISRESDHEAESILDLDIQIEHRNYKNHSLEIFAQHIRQINDFNLLQGEFTPKRQTSFGWLQPWKAVAGITAVWITLQLGYAVLETSQLEASNLEISKQIEQQFKRAMPEARKTSNMQKRVERKLSELKSGAGSTSKEGFLQILDKASPIISSSKKIDIKAAVYRNNYIDMDMSASSLQDIEKLKAQLDKLPGIKVVLSTSVEKDMVKGRLRLEANG